MVKADVRKPSLFDDSDDESDGGAKLQVNAEYAKRFEHNKKREELHRLEEKFKTKQTNGDKSKGDDDDDSDSSSDVTEDENGFLATEELDAQLNATLQAIKNKDPRVYDGKTTFYAPIEDTPAVPAASDEKKEKPVFLRDYHREKLLRGDIGADDEDDKEPPRTYAQEQEDLKKSIRNEIQAQTHVDADESEEDDFLKAKGRPKLPPAADGVHPSRAAKVKARKPDLAEADKDPELFLSNFMASRAWVDENGNGWEAFESDDQDDDHLQKADEWEAAYNLRFEDPHKSNEVLKTYARDVTAARSVRREEKTARKRQRELESERREAERQERKADRARLRRLKIEEAESKLQKIKKAAGLSKKTLKEEDWQKVLEDAWDNDKWEEKMKEMFNDEYYEEAEGVSDSDDDEDGAGAGGSKKKVKKPKWDDDIDIKDLVPDFDDEERPNVTLTDEDEQEEEDEEEDEDGAPATKRRKTTKDRKRERLATQKEARQERTKIEALVDAHMAIEEPEALTIAAGPSSSKKKYKQVGDPDMPRFAYRETRPETFGLTTRDILMASDADLNEYAGLKKLAHFRDPDKQARDRKKLGKKARLRRWRRDTFGPEFEHDPPAFNPGGDGPLRIADEERGGHGPKDGGEKNADANIVEGEGGGKKKRKRSGRKKGKGKEGESVEAE
ncbi:Kinetochore protein Spc24 [Diatrype stigma]|uniref:Kinetochore protein Spc24 n=1 Tax=Diatrype stigma TaxID=117547 RepID=A0AAN9YMS6_9PEZI